MLGARRAWPAGLTSREVDVLRLLARGLSSKAIAAARAVRELRCVLRPGGRLVFIEHVRSDEPGLARLQDRLNGLNRFVVCCDCNRPTLATIEADGFRVTELERTTMNRVPPFARPLLVGSAAVGEAGLATPTAAVAERGVS